jgi:hypothetical protein
MRGALAPSLDTPLEVTAERHFYINSEIKAI